MHLPRARDVVMGFARWNKLFKQQQRTAVSAVVVLCSLILTLFSTKNPLGRKVTASQPG